MGKLSATVGSLLFFIVAPGVVAGFIPWWLTGWETNPTAPWVGITGIVLICTGIAALVYSFVGFVLEGVGTPAPVAPTERLVVGGLYRHVRNPMYVAVVGIVVGQAALLGRPVLLVYAVIAGATMGAFAKWYEEPALAERFGESYLVYRENVPGWWPRMTPWDPVD